MPKYGTRHFFYKLNNFNLLRLENYQLHITFAFIMKFIIKGVYPCSQRSLLKYTKLFGLRMYKRNIPLTKPNKNARRSKRSVFNEIRRLCHDVHNKISVFVLEPNQEGLREETHGLIREIENLC